MNNASYSKAQESIYLSHPLRVTLCQVVVDGYNVHAFAFQRVKIRRQCGNQSLTFACLHLGDTSLMKGYTADYLHLEMLHAYASCRRLSAHSKSLNQYIVQGLACCQSFLELGCLALKFLI